MMDKERSADAEIIQNGQAVMGLEMGSTRIKAVLIDSDHNPLASGSFAWKNTMDDGL